MNILYLHTHDIGRCLSVYGAPVETPGIEALVRSGATVFHNAHSVAPTCSPSRVALLTGQYPHQQGMLGLAHRGHRMSFPERHMAHWLKQAGLHTALAGVQHEFPHDVPSPYSEVLEGNWEWGVPGYDASVAGAAVTWLAQRPVSCRPFFLSVGFFWPHVPLPESPMCDDPCNLISGLPDREAVEADSASLRQAVIHTDRAFAAVLRALANSPHASNTVVILTTDHGIPFPHHKGTLSDRGTGVSLLLKVPGLKGPEGSHALVSHLDVFPTLCELLRIEPPDWLEGKSLVPLLTGEAEELHPLILTTTNEHVDWEPARAVRTQRYKLVRHFSPRERSLANVDESASKHMVAADGYFAELWPELELFDLEEDPEETHNRIDDPGLAKVRLELEAQLEQLMRRTQDPLLAQVV